MSRMSQAFAAHQQAVLMELVQKLQVENVPAFNAEAEDIRRQHEEDSHNLKVGENLADHKKRARIRDLTVRRTTFINSLQTELHEKLAKRVEEYKGKVMDAVDKKDKPIKVVEFPDGTKAKLARNLWVDYGMYDRV